MEFITGAKCFLYAQTIRNIDATIKCKAAVMTFLTLIKSVRNSKNHRGNMLILLP